MNFLYKILAGMIIGKAVEMGIRAGGKQLLKSGKETVGKHWGELTGKPLGEASLHTGSGVTQVHFDGATFTSKTPMPGMTKDHVSVSVYPDRLEIYANKTHEVTTNAGSRGENVEIQEVIRLPSDLDIDNMDTALAKGVLVVTIPLKQQPTRVTVRRKKNVPV